MNKIPPGVLMVFLLLGTGIAGAVPQKKYDVSYLWHSDFAQVVKYRESVLRVLGPQMRKNLKVVRGKRLFGLIYDRDGDSRATQELASYHSSLLKESGLESCVMVASEGWPVASSRRSKVDEPMLAQRPENRPVPNLPIQKTPSQGALKNLPGLEDRIDGYIQGQRERGKLKADEKTSWSVFDLTSGEKLADINEDKPMQAASLIKPFFAMAYFQQVAEGKLYYGPKSQRKMAAMIRHSDNRATNWVLRQLGGPQSVDRLLKERYSHIFQDTQVVEYIPWGGRTYKNTASVRDYSRFLFALWHGNIPGAPEIKRLMALPNRDRLYSGAREVPKGTKVYDKTGSTKYLCGNMGILEVRGKDGKEYAYTLIGVIQKDRPANNYTSWITSRGDMIREVSNIVYREMEVRHGLAGR